MKMCCTCTCTCMNIHVVDGRCLTLIAVLNNGESPKGELANNWICCCSWACCCWTDRFCNGF